MTEFEEKGSIKEKVHRQLQELKKTNKELYGKFIAHSRDYKRALELTDGDLEDLDHLQERPPNIFPSLHDYPGFVSLEVKGERFVLSVRNVAGRQYGGSWTYEVMAVCVTNEQLNKQAGGGTSLINMIPEEYHTAIINHIKEEK